MTVRRSFSGPEKAQIVRADLPMVLVREGIIRQRLANTLPQDPGVRDVGLYDRLKSREEVRV